MAPSGTATWIASHWGVVSAVAVTAFTLVKVGHESRWQSNTLTAAFSAGSTFEVLVPVVIISGALAASVLAVLVIVAWFPWMHRCWLWSIPFLVLLLLVPTYLNIFLALFVLSVWVRDVATGPESMPATEQRRGELATPKVRIWIAGYLSLLLFVAIGLGGMWLPAEALRVKHEGVEIGYVLGVEGPWTTVMIEHDRTLRHYPSESIIERTPCDPGVPAFNLLFGPPWLPYGGPQGDERSCSTLRVLPKGGGRSPDAMSMGVDTFP